MNEQESVTLSLGQRLAELRQQANFTVNDIARELYVCPEMIDKIETDRTDQIPTVFLRGYLRAYAKKVNLSEEELAPYIAQLSGNKPHVTTVNQNLYRERRRFFGKGFFRIILFSLLLAAVIGGYVIWQGYKATQHTTTGHIPTRFINQADEP